MRGCTKNVQAISKMRMTFNFPSITKMRRSFAIYFLRKIFERYSNVYIFCKDNISKVRVDRTELQEYFKYTILLQNIIP